MSVTNPVKFYFCTLDKYNALTVKESNALYFVTDAKRLYKGDVLYNGGFEIVSVLPETGINGTMYYASTTGTISLWEGNAWVSKFLPYEIELSGNGKAVPTSKAVTDLLGVNASVLGSTGSLFTKDDGTGKISLNSAYNPGISLQFNGKSVGAGITSLNFGGTTTITVGDDGVAKVQIGENMNSSAWNTKDGKNGDGTVTGFPTGNSIIIPDATNASFKVGNWNAGDSKSVGSTDSSLSISSTGVIHMDEGVNTWSIKVYGATGKVLVEANVNDTVAYNDTDKPTSATVTASAISYVTGSAGISHTIESGEIEPNYPSAVGGCAKVTFGFDLTKIDEIKNGGRYHIVIAGCGGTYTSPERFYINSETPVIESATLTFNNDAEIKTVSGVKYVKGGTFTLATGNITNLNNQAGVSTRVSIASTSDFSDEDTAIASDELTGFTNAYNNISTYTDTGLTLGSNLNKRGTNLSIELTPNNAKGSGTTVTVSVGGLNINTYAETESTNSTEHFKSENMRLANDLSDWSSTAALGTEDLQVIPGEGLVYPQTDFSAIATPASNPNYSTCSGTRYFTRKMIAGSGTVFGGTLTLGGANRTDMTFAKLSIDGGTTWYNLLAARGGADATGILNEDKSSGGEISFTFPGTTSMTASNGIYIKIGWSNKSVKVTSITLAM